MPKRNGKTVLSVFPITFHRRGKQTWERKQKKAEESLTVLRKEVEARSGQLAAAVETATAAYEKERGKADGMDALALQEAKSKAEHRQTT